MYRFEHHRFEHHWIFGHPHPWGHEFGWGPGMLQSALSTLFWVALLLGLAWLLLRWIIPYIIPMFADIFDTAPAGPSALEILRQRYAAGEIDATTFEQMWERLEASYPRESYGLPHDDIGYSGEKRTGYRDTFPSPISREQRNVWMAEQEQYPSETES